MSKQTLILGDCVTAIEEGKIPKVDCIVTSPPYNVNLGYKTYNDELDDNVYVEWLCNVFTHLLTVLKDDGHIFLNIDGTNAKPYLPFEIVSRIRRMCVVQNVITWVKSIAINDETTGHFKPINSNRFLNHTHEYIFHFTKSGKLPIARKSIGVPYMDKSNIARRRHAEDKRCRGDTWFIPYETVASKEQKFNHPGTFPILLPQMCLRLVGKEKGVVYDPFVGVGTSLLAANSMGWDGYGTDIDASYLETAQIRLHLAKAEIVYENGVDFTKPLD